MAKKTTSKTNTPRDPDKATLRDRWLKLRRKR